MFKADKEFDEVSRTKLGRGRVRLARGGRRPRLHPREHAPVLLREEVNSTRRAIAAYRPIKPEGQRRTLGLSLSFGCHVPLTLPAAMNAVQKLLRLPRRVHRVVAVPAQFDVDAARVVRGAEAREHVREVHLALAEHQVIVDAAAHVLDVDVPQHVLPLREELADRQFAVAHEVADVDREPERGVVDAARAAPRTCPSCR